MLPTVSETTSALQSLQAIIHAVAQTLRCNSASLALLEEERQALRMAVAVNPRSAGDLLQVEHTIGFQIGGLHIPLKLERSLLVRALREERVLLTTDVADLAGGALPVEIIEAIHSITGLRSFAVVPVQSAHHLCRAGWCRAGVGLAAKHRAAPGTAGRAGGAAAAAVDLRAVRRWQSAALSRPADGRAAASSGAADALARAAV